MTKCDKHPGRDADPNGSFFGKSYCKKCAEQIKRAQSNVRAHVTPRDCFMLYKNSSTGWESPIGSGCAHWVAHQLGIKNGFSDGKCALEYSFRVPDVISGARKIDREKEDVKVGDIWRHRGGLNSDHCGLVVKVEENKGGGQKITVRHCSSTHEQGVISSDFATYLKGKGDFYRR